MNLKLLQLSVALLLINSGAPAAVRYVDLNNPNPSPPYGSWATAATNIQEAVDAAASGDQVLVTNGLYQTGGSVVHGALSNRVAVTRAVVVQSVNGPAETVIRGVAGAGDASVRCAYLTNGAFLSGFTLSDGGTREVGDDGLERAAGGVWGESTSAVVSNCVIISNSARRWGGGAAYLTLLDCVLTGNSAEHGGGAIFCAMTNCVLTNNSAYYGGGARDSTLDHCVVNDNVGFDLGGGIMTSTLNHCALTNNRTYNYSGGGVYGGTLDDCSLVNNNAAGSGGGASDATLHNCVLAGNSGSSGGGASFSSLNNCLVAGNTGGGNGGGAWYCGLNNCTVTGNSAPIAGGADQSGLNNCILYYNTAANAPNHSGSTLNYCCTVPLPTVGSGNIGSDPLMTDGLHLSAESPCRGAGSPAYANGADLEGQLWGSPPSIGCDEYYPGPATGSLAVTLQASYTNFAVGFSASFAGQVSGQASANRWDFGDGAVVSNRLAASHVWAAPGDYSVVFRAFNDSFPGGASATVAVHVVTQPVHYVSAGGSSPAAPYASWSTAATKIQDAIEASSVTGALVLVTNGTYQTGGKIISGTLLTRAAVTKPLAVRSVNGPAATIIQGFQVPVSTNGDGAVRCAYLANDAALIGFTLTGGATRTDGDAFLEQCGGGVRCEPSGVISNCVLNANSANRAGGGASGGTLSFCTLSANTCPGTGGGACDAVLINCAITGCSSADGGGVNSCALNNCTLANNSAIYGGGASSCALNNCSVYDNTATSDGGGARNSSLNNCTLTGNSAPTGGGAAQCGANNSILYFNGGTVGANYWGGTLNYCCTTPLPGAGVGNLAAPPLLADFAHLSPGSPCITAGNSAYAKGVDIDGDLWVTPPAVGCDQYYAGGATGPLSVSIQADYTNVAAGFPVDLLGVISGHATSNRWDFGDGTAAGGSPQVSHSWTVAGDYQVVFRAYNQTYPGGLSATAAVHVVAQPVYYVAAANATPAAPYSSWASAATSIQDAVDAAAIPGALVLVTNGTYQTGGKKLGGALTNRVAVDKPLLLSSVNGPAQTVIKGNPGVGDAAVRCVYAAKGTVLSGFTLTSGASRSSGDTVLEQSGGGAWCEAGVVISNCVFTSNSVAWYGGAVYGASLYDCLLVGNSAYVGGAACASLLSNCVLGASSARTGGGAQGCSLTGCTLTNNNAGASGGGAYDSLLSRCLLSRNHSGSGGGGVENSTLYNCVLALNSASEGGGAAVSSTLNNCTVLTNSSGVDYCTVNNCIVYYNDYGNAYSSTLNYCCTTPIPGSGAGNFTNEPLVLNLSLGDFHLQAGSPCINSGNNAFAPGVVDLDGHPRVVGGTVDTGAYEFGSPGSRISYAWLQQYGLPTDGSADLLDPDNDGLSNWQEWVAGTIPNDPASALRLLAPTLPAVTLQWQSTADRFYSLERAAGPTGPGSFSIVASNIPGRPGTTSYTDPGAPGPGPAFYRVGVSR